MNFDKTTEMITVFSALKLLPGYQEEHLNGVIICWLGHLSRARCSEFVYGPADTTATLSSLASLKPRMAYPSGTVLPRLSLKRGH